MTVCVIPKKPQEGAVVLSKMVVPSLSMQDSLCRWCLLRISINLSCSSIHTLISFLPASNPFIWIELQIQNFRTENHLVQLHFVTYKLRTVYLRSHCFSSEHSTGLIFFFLFFQIIKCLGSLFLVWKAAEWEKPSMINWVVVNCFKWPSSDFFLLVEWKPWIGQVGRKDSGPGCGALRIKEV